ncbi:MAG: cytochrome c3 family protein [Bryobacteraceae bacterium]|nr:cytochrome c3 family protein [Bryobacteraceae bacterium]
MRIALAVGLLVVAGLLMIPTASFVYESGGPQACARCHEMGNQVDLWHDSAHRGIACAKCHGDALTTDPEFHLTNAKRVWSHWRGEVGEQFGLKPAAVFQIVERCASCHQQEFAAWSTGPHAVTYKRIFTDEKHNKSRHLMDDCFRCHGSHFDGAIGDLVAPVDNKGPWRLVRAEVAEKPAVPCLACHSVHRKGSPLNQRLLESKTPGNRQEKHRPGLAFYDRRAKMSVSASMLAIPAVLDNGRPVRMSPDVRQSLCYQCHAPLSTREAGTGDDRTPRGIHEGLSCMACHDKHRQTTRASCGTCHPRLSNCGLDVESMDTTFAKPGSRHNIHSVRCTDCHEKGVPRKRVDAGRVKAGGAG